MKVKDIIKKQTTVIAIAVIMITITVIGVSYSVFFDVKKNSQNQVITAGDLSMEIVKDSDLTMNEPVSESKAKEVNYTLSNKGSLNALYDLYIYKSDANTVDFSFIKYSINGSTPAVLSTITDVLDDGGKRYYKIDSGTLNVGESKNQKIKVWVDEDLVTDSVDGKTIDLWFYITSEVKES